MNDSTDTLNNQSLDSNVTILNKFKEVLEKHSDDTKYVYFQRESRIKRSSTKSSDKNNSNEK